jgi:hypothetical protein
MELGCSTAPPAPPMMAVRLALTSSATWSSVPPPRAETAAQGGGGARPTQKLGIVQPVQAEGPPDGATVAVMDGVGGLLGETLGVPAVPPQRLAGMKYLLATLPLFVAFSTVLFVAPSEQRNGPT